MAKGPPRKKNSIFLDSSSSEESEASYAESDSADEEEPESKEILSISSDDDSIDSLLNDPFLHTQPQRVTRNSSSSPEKSSSQSTTASSECDNAVKLVVKKVGASPRSGSLVTDAYEMVPLNDLDEDISGAKKDNTNGIAPVHGLRKKGEKQTGQTDGQLQSDPEASKIPPKMRLKLQKMKEIMDTNPRQESTSIESKSSSEVKKLQNVSKKVGKSPIVQDSLTSLPPPSSPKSSTKKRALENSEQNVAPCTKTKDNNDAPVAKNVQESSQSSSQTTPNASQNSNKGEGEVKKPTTGVKRKKRKVAKKHSIDSNNPTASKDSPKSSTVASKPAAKASSSSTAATKPATNAVSPKPTPKPKRKKKTFQEQVLLHILTTMKPFTLKSLATELRTTDIALHHIMLSLLDKQVVRRKEVGKKVKKELYWVDIENATKELYGKQPFSREESLATKQELNRVRAQESELLREIQIVESDISNEKLDQQLAEKEKNIQELKDRINAAKGRINSSTHGGESTKIPAGGRQISRVGSRFQVKPKKPLTKKQLQKGINHMRGEWKARKEKCTDFLDNLADAMEKKPKEINKLLGIETDEMTGVKLPPKQVIDS